MLKADWRRYDLVFKKKSKTSRAEMTQKETFFIRVFDDGDPRISGYGEAALFRGLSADDTPDYERELSFCCQNVNDIKLSQIPSSSIRFGFETALADLSSGANMKPFNPADDWQIKINGLVWMADMETMTRQASEKIDAGFNCVKLKIGGIDFEQEIEIIRTLRERFPPSLLEIRLDANGAFSPADAMAKLERLSRFDIHSIEQPIRQHQPEAMAMICKNSPIPIALDEELIGITPDQDKHQLLNFIKPSYIILKPSLCGGFVEADHWIEAAENAGIGWWATSALESDIGLNAIARWASLKKPEMPQGLGTGQLYINNVKSPLSLKSDLLTSDSSAKWDLSNISI